MPSSSTEVNALLVEQTVINNWNVSSACLIIEANSILSLKSLFIKWNVTYSPTLLSPALSPALQAFAINDDASFSAMFFSVASSMQNVSVKTAALTFVQQKLQSYLSSRICYPSLLPNALCCLIPILLFLPNLHCITKSSWYLTTTLYYSR